MKTKWKFIAIAFTTLLNVTPVQAKEGMESLFEEQKKAAEQGDVLSQFILGDMYYQGRGVPQDYSQAYAWFSVAVANGYEHSIELRDSAAKKLSSSDLIKAQKLAAEYFEKYQPVWR